MLTEKDDETQGRTPSEEEIKQNALLQKIADGELSPDEAVTALNALETGVAPDYPLPPAILEIVSAIYLDTFTGPLKGRDRTMSEQDGVSEADDADTGGDSEGDDVGTSESDADGEDEDGEPAETEQHSSGAPNRLRAAALSRGAVGNQFVGRRVGTTMKYFVVPTYWRLVLRAEEGGTAVPEIGTYKDTDTVVLTANEDVIAAFRKDEEERARPGRMSVAALTSLCVFIPVPPGSTISQVKLPTDFLFAFASYAASLAIPRKPRDVVYDAAESFQIGTDPKSEDEGRAPDDLPESHLDADRRAHTIKAMRVAAGELDGPVLPDKARMDVATAVEETRTGLGRVSAKHFALVLPTSDAHSHSFEASKVLAMTWLDAALKRRALHRDALPPEPRYRMIAIGWRTRDGNNPSERIEGGGVAIED